MQPFSTITSRVISLPFDDIDTDQIIPAQFLKITDKSGLAKNLFFNWRYQADGSPRSEFVLNQEEAKTAQILFAGKNFGCGSSREHAPWALIGFGFRVVIASSFGDIFRNNSLKNGLLPVSVGLEDHEKMKSILEKNPNSSWSVDLENQVVILPSGEEIHFEIDLFSKTCLIKGIDELGYILSFSDRIAEYEQIMQL